MARKKNCRLLRAFDTFTLQKGWGVGVGGEGEGGGVVEVQAKKKLEAVVSG